MKLLFDTCFPLASGVCTAKQSGPTTKGGTILESTKYAVPSPELAEVYSSALTLSSDRKLHFKHGGGSSVLPYQPQPQNSQEAEQRSEEPTRKLLESQFNEH